MSYKEDLDEAYHLIWLKPSFSTMLVRRLWLFKIIKNPCLLLDYGMFNDCYIIGFLFRPKLVFEVIIGSKLAAKALASTSIIQCNMNRLENTYFARGCITERLTSCLD